MHTVHVQYNSKLIEVLTAKIAHDIVHVCTATGHSTVTRMCDTDQAKHF